MIDYELTDRDLRTWEQAMADDSPPLFPDSKLFWFTIGKFEQRIAHAA